MLNDLPSNIIHKHREGITGIQGLGSHARQVESGLEVMCVINAASHNPSDRKTHACASLSKTIRRGQAYVCALTRRRTIGNLVVWAPAWMV